MEKKRLFSACRCGDLKTVQDLMTHVEAEAPDLSPPYLAYRPLHHAAKYVYIIYYGHRL